MTNPSELNERGVPSVIRPPGMYVRYRGEWFHSTQRWSGSTKMPWVELRPNGAGATFRIDPSEVEEVVRVEPEVEYEGFWFLLDGLQRGSDPAQVWHPMDPSAPDCFVNLWYVDRDQHLVAQLAGATDHDDRGSMGGVTLTARGADLTGYREKITPASVTSP